MKKKSSRYGRSSLGQPLETQGSVASLSQNISQSGMLCRTSRWFDELTLLDIRFQLPHGAPALQKAWIECTGVVVTCEKKESDSFDMPYEVAIYFDSISEKNRMLLSQYCHKGEW